NEGNLIRRARKIVTSEGVQEGEVTEYEWDHRNRLSEVTVRESGIFTTPFKRFSYTYDAFDRRIAKSVDNDLNDNNPAQIERFVYDRGQIVLTFDESNKQTHRYLYGPAVDQVLAEEDAEAHPGMIGELFFPLADHLGTVRDLIDIEGENRNHLTYDS